MTINITIKNTEKQIKNFCARVGSDPLLVQGAGGNTSWKVGSTLWVKASGTWLAEAAEKDIFIPVDLPHLQLAISNHDFSVIPQVKHGSNFRPSIETLLHALMPHKIVVHLHAIEILAHLVRDNPEEFFKKVFEHTPGWVCVDYFKPGAELAEAVSKSMETAQNIDVVFLKNHGVVIGGKNVEQIESILSQLLSSLTVDVAQITSPQLQPVIDLELQAKGYTQCNDPQINQLALDKELSSRLYDQWSLYPDHVVFLGEEAFIIDQPFSSKKLKDNNSNNPPYVFIIGSGVFEHETLTKAQKEQLRCYYDVLIRQGTSDKLVTLNQQQVRELLVWDAEEYRSKLSRA